jgi:flagellar biosynthesis/type III secretory pathway M-ring protein FliF/YscJ
MRRPRPRGSAGRATLRSRPPVTLAEKGLPRGGSIRDDIFDQQSAPGTANFLVNVNLRRALGGEPARAMAPLADDRAARRTNPG